MVNPKNKNGVIIMPGMPIFQDLPSQLKGQIYVLDSTTQTVVPLQVDDAGSLAVNGTVDLNAGATIDNITNITNDVKIVNGADPLEVGLNSGSNVIGKVENELVFTNLDAFGEDTPLTPMTVGTSASVVSEVQDISKENSYNWFIKNTGEDSSDQNITLVVELSPDQTNWIEDTAVEIEIPFNTAKMITINNFLQYARFTITGGAAETTVISCFQAQH